MKPDGSAGMHGILENVSQKDGFQKKTKREENKNEYEIKCEVINVRKIRLRCR